VKCAFSTLQSQGVLVVAHYNFPIWELQAQALQWHDHMPLHGLLLHAVEPRALLLQTSWPLVREEASQPTCCTVSSVGLFFSPNGSEKKATAISMTHVTDGIWNNSGQEKNGQSRSNLFLHFPWLAYASARLEGRESGAWNWNFRKNSNDLLQYLVIIASRSLGTP